MDETMTRRQFLCATGALIGGAAALGPLAACSTQPNRVSVVATPSQAFEGDGDVSKRVLVGYATRTGSTVGVAEAIGETLAARGFDVDVKPLKERPALDGYDACVLGSAVNGGQWLEEAVRFVQTNRNALSAIPTALFCVHIMNAGDDERAKNRRLAYLDKVRALVTPSDEGFFLGKGPTSEDTSLIARWAFRAFGGAGEGDLRDWDGIRGWARQAHV